MTTKGQDGILSTVEFLIFFLCLMKYTAFISLLNPLENSWLCYLIRGIPSNLVGCADDLLSTTVSKTSNFVVYQIVYEYGRQRVCKSHKRTRRNVQDGESSAMVRGGSTFP